jgi:hypothetical protein
MALGNMRANGVRSLAVRCAAALAAKAGREQSP